MGNEMGNSNFSGLKEEEINTAVAAPEKFSQESNYINDLKGENQVVPEGEGIDFHEKVEGLASDDPSGAGDCHGNKPTSGGKEQDETELDLSSQTREVPIESNDAACQDSGIQAASSSNEVNHLEKPTGSNLEENLFGTSDEENKKQTSRRRGEVEKSNSTSETKYALEPLEFLAPMSNQYELSEVDAEPPAAGDNRSPPCEPEEKGNSLETEATPTLAESVVSDAKEDAEKTKDDPLVKEMASKEESLVDSSIGDDKHEIGTKYEVENGLSNMASNFQSGLDNKCNEDGPTERNLRRNGSSKSTREANSQTNSSNSFEFHEPQDKLIRSGSENEEINMAGSGSERAAIGKDSRNMEMNVAQNGYLSNSCNGKPKEQNKDSEELIEMTPAIETVPRELSVTEYRDEEEEPTEKKVIEAVEQKPETSKGIGTGTEARETTEQPMTQSCQIGYPKGSSVDSKNRLVSTVGLLNDNPGQSNEQCLEVETSAFTSAWNEAQETSARRLRKGSIPENPTAHSELRKFPSFEFDLSLKARSEESDQTPLLHHGKTSTRSLSSMDGSSFRNPIALRKYDLIALQNQAISVEEKTIKVERSDSDKSRAPLQNFLKEEKKASQKQEGCVLDKKRKPRPSLFSTCICCAAAIN